MTARVTSAGLAQRVLGRYRVEHLLGAGGMSQVYAATDLELGRAVALKILPPDRASNAARVQAFIREAQLASSLNHPAIVTVLDAGTTELEGAPVRFLVMERVDGEPLDLWAAARRRDLRALVETMAAIADGLASAHARGIVHCDFKPGNVIVAKNGQPKILDFGIAKLIEPAHGSDGRESDTAPAAVVGTAAYMSPEQVEGLPVDARSDVFSFGAVLYEILGGSPAFRKTRNPAAVETMHTILAEDPKPLEQVRRGMPPEIYRIVRKCLVKNRDERYQSIKDVAIDLRELLRDGAGPVAAPRRRWMIRAATVLLGIVFVAAIVALVANSAQRRVVSHPVTVPASAPTTVRMTNTGAVETGAISPDGKTIVHADREGENETLWITQVATGTRVRVLPPAPVYYVQIRVSADGNYIYYSSASRANPNVVNLMQVPLLGGEPRSIASNMEGPFALAPDGTRVVFTRFDAVEREFRLTMAEIESSAETILTTRRYPKGIGSFAWTPSGRNLTFVEGSRGADNKPILLNLAISSRRVTPMRTPDWPGVGTIAWLPDGSGMLVNVADRRQPPQVWFLSRNGSVARKITSDVANYGAVTVTADSKTFAANRLEASSNLWVVSTDNPSDAKPVTTGLGNHFGDGGVRWLPDGRLLFTVFTPADAWLSEVSSAGGEPHQLTRGGAAWQPAVSPDGSRLAFVSDRGEANEIWLSNIDGSGMARLTRDSGAAFPSWTPDGTGVVYMTSAQVQRARLAKVASGATTELTTAPTNMPRLSPDGKWLLCRLRTTDAANRPVWRTALLPASGKGTPRYFEIPRYGGGPRLEWLPDSRAFAFVDFRDGVGNVWIQSLDGSPPRQLTRFDSGDITGFDFSRDGRKLAVARCVESNDMVVIRDFR